MKTITTTASVRKADSSLDATLNPVELSSKEIVAWGIAFPRPDLVRRGDTDLKLDPSPTVGIVPRSATKLPPARVTAGRP